MRCCRLLLVRIFVATLLLASCRPKPDDSDGGKGDETPLEEEPAVGTPAPAAEAQRLLDLTGIYSNLVELGLGSSSAVFAFSPEAEGTLLLIGLDYKYGTCDRSSLDVRVFLKSFLPDGGLAKVYELETMRPLRVQGGEHYQLSVQSSGRDDCTGASVSIALRYFAVHLEDRKHADGASPGGAMSTGGDDHQPGGPTSTGPDPDPGPDHPAPCPPLGDDLGEGAPAVLKGGFVFYGRNSAADGCKALLSVRFRDLVKRENPPECALPKVAVDTRSSTSTPLLKLTQTLEGYPFNLLWLRIGDQARATVIQSAIESGQSLKLIAGPNDCPDLPAEPGSLVLADDLDLILFKGDPRDSCLGGGGPAEILDLNPAASTVFQVAYDYRAATTARFFWRLSFALPGSAATGPLATGARGRLYNRRTRSFLAPWQDLTKNADGTLKLEFNDSAVLHRLLPHQKDVQIVLAPKAAGEQCSSAYVLPFDRFVLDPALIGRFQDAAAPGTSPQKIDEADLPE